MLGLIPVISVYTALIQTTLSLYMIWYIFRSMRVYYQQGRALTLAKYLTIGLAYLVTTILVLMLSALFTALTL